MQNNTQEPALLSFEVISDSIPNKVVKPHNGPSAILDLIAIGYRVVDDATCFYGFGINGSLETGYN